MTDETPSQPPLEYAGKDTAAPSRRGLLVVMLVAAFAIAFGVGALIWRLTDSGGGAAPPVAQLRCAQNLVQLGVTLQFYSFTHDNVYPRSFETMVREDVTPALFVCPGAPDTPAVGATPQQRAADFRKPGHCSYVYALGSLPASAVTRDHVVAYEPLSNHGGTGMNVLFGDLRTEWLGKREAARLLAELQAGFNPPRP